MNKLLPLSGLVTLAVCFTGLTLYAQQTLPFIFEVTAPVHYAWTNEDVGEVVDFGVPITQTITGQLAWAETGNPDPVISQEICTPATNDLTGKIAMIRRGSCNFSLKIYHAQQAGAIAAIICNNDPAGGLVNMLGGDSASAVNIPAIFLRHDDCHTILAPLMTQGPVDAQFRVLNFYKQQAVLAYQTPLSQVKPLDSIGVTIANREMTTANNVEVSVQITDPDGEVATLTKTVNILPDSELDVRFDPFTPDKTGTYQLLYSSSLYPQDAISGEFIITDHTFGLDNGVLNAGIGPSEQQFINLGLNYHMGSVYFPGPAGGVATHASFAVANPQDMAGETFIAVLFDMNPANDPNYVIGNPLDYSGYNAVATALYTYSGSEAPHELIVFELETLTGGAITLKPDGIYMMTVQYEGITTGNVIPPQFSHGGVNPYYTVNSTVYMDRLYIGGWSSGTNPAIRLHQDGFVTSQQPVSLLDGALFELFPVPAGDNLYLRTRFPNSTYTEIQIFDLAGRQVLSRIMPDVGDEQITLDIAHLQKGHYFLRIQTEDGFRTLHFKVVR